MLDRPALTLSEEGRFSAFSDALDQAKKIAENGRDWRRSKRRRVLKDYLNGKVGLRVHVLVKDVAGSTHVYYGVALLQASSRPLDDQGLIGLREFPVSERSLVRAECDAWDADGHWCDGPMLVGNVEMVEDEAPSFPPR